MKTERWVFTDDELGRPEECRADDEFIALNDVIIKRNGVATNRYVDGIPGVSPADKSYAESEDTHLAPGGDIADTWRDVIVDDNRFVEFAK